MKKVLKTSASLLLAACLFASCASTDGASTSQTAENAPQEAVAPSEKESPALQSQADTSSLAQESTEDTALTDSTTAQDASEQTMQDTAPREQTAIDESLLEAVPAEEAVIVEAEASETAEPAEQWVVTDEPFVMDAPEEDLSASAAAAEEADSVLAETNAESGVIAENKEEPDALSAAEVTENADAALTQAEVTQTPEKENRESTVIEGPADNVQVTDRQPFTQGTQTSAAAAQTQTAASGSVGKPATAVTPAAPLVQEGTQAAVAEESVESSSADPSEIEKAIPVPSRSVTVKKNQYLDIVYPGSGWVYLGEADGTRLFTYFGRKLGTSDTTFTLRSRASGETLLHFYKTDALTGSYIDDYLSVTVENTPATSNEHVKAPDYASIVPPKPSRTRASSAAKVAKASPHESTEILAPKVADGATNAAAEEASSNEQAAAPQTSSASADERGGKTVVQTTGGTQAESRVNEASSPVLSSLADEPVVEQETSRATLPENLPADALNTELSTAVNLYIHL